MEKAIEVLIAPASAISRLKNEAEPRFGVTVFLCSWLSLVISVFLALRKNASPGEFLAAFILSATVIVPLFVLKIMSLHSVAGWMGGEGRLKNFAAMLVYCLAPLNLLLPATLIARSVAGPLLFPSWLAILIWTASLGFRTVKENYGLTATRTLVALAAPLVFTVFILALLASALYGFFFGGLLISLLFSATR